MNNNLATTFKKTKVEETHIMWHQSGQAVTIDRLDLEILGSSSNCLMLVPKLIARVCANKITTLISTQ